MKVFAPGRVNLIGDHVDYLGGLVLPMAIDLGTTVEFEPGGSVVTLTSADDPTPLRLELPISTLDSQPEGWGRYVAAVLMEMDAERGFAGSVTTSIPIGAGLSSSTALSIALALAAGFEGTALELCHLSLRAEVAATGVPGGLMDQIAITHAVPNHALLIDCRELTAEPVRLPSGTAVHAVHSGVTRRLAGSVYGARRARCEEAEREVGPLRDANLDDLEAIEDRTVRARARHVVTEIERVAEAAAAARADDAVAFGRLMLESHQSLRDDFEVSIPELDHLVERLMAIPGVYGARLTGAGFGGCVVALVDESLPTEAVGGWRLDAGPGARLLSD